MALEGDVCVKFIRIQYRNTHKPKRNYRNIQRGECKIKYNKKKKRVPCVYECDSSNSKGNCSMLKDLLQSFNHNIMNSV